MCVVAALRHKSALWEHFSAPTPTFTLSIQRRGVPTLALGDGFVLEAFYLHIADSETRGWRGICWWCQLAICGAQCRLSAECTGQPLDSEELRGMHGVLVSSRLFKYEFIFLLT